jgi:hypothetical protein
MPWGPYRKNEEDTAGDEFRRYSIAGSNIPATERFGPVAWWSQPEVEEAFPILQRWALYIFACPATSCECERAFSSAKKIITLERNLVTALTARRVQYGVDPTSSARPVLHQV